jgi:hypothetical protein
MSFLGISNTPTLAFALNQLDPSYTGPLIQVRRSIDNAIANVGIVSGNLDTSTLLSFAANTNAYVTTWYNQNNSGNNAVQANTSLQPQIVTAGALTATMFGRAALQFNQQMLIAPTSWAPNPFSVIIAFNNYDNNQQYGSLLSTPFTTGTNSVSLGTVNNVFGVWNVGLSGTQSTLTYSGEQDYLITWTSPNGWSSGGTLDTLPTVSYPYYGSSAYPFSTPTYPTNLTYPTDTITTTSRIGADGDSGVAGINSYYLMAAVVAFPENLSAADLQTAMLNVANAIGIPITGPAYQYSTIAEVVGTNSSNAQVVSVTAEAPTFNISNARVASITLEVLCSVVNAAVLPSGYNSYVSVIES